MAALKTASVALLFLSESFALRIKEIGHEIKPLNSIQKPSSRFTLTEGTFSRQELTGTPICGELIPELANATWAYSTRDGSVLTYTCNVGFKTSTGGNQFKYTCVAGRPLTSTILPDSCSIVRCPKPGSIDHAELVWKEGPAAPDAEFGNVVDYRCEKGYTGDGKAHGPKSVKKICSDSGKFEFVLETIQSCNLIRCDAPISIRNAILDPTMDRSLPVYYNNSINYTCPTGFVSSIDGKGPAFNLTCGEEGEYVPNDPMPRCRAASCPVPPVLPNAATLQVSGTVPVGSQVLYRCTSGFMVSKVPASSTFFISCDIVGGKPFYVIPPLERQCQAANCLPLPTLMNAHIADGKEAWRYQDTAQFECDQGYSLGSVKGATSFTGFCNSQGLWTISDHPKCAPMICAETSKEVPIELLGYARAAPFTQEPIIFGMNTTVNCISGAVVTGTDQRESSFDLECGPDGDFVSNGVCAVPCSPLPKVSHSTSAHFGQVLEYGEAPARIRCRAGYATKSGETIQEITCSRDGTLSPIEDCVTDSGYLTNPDNGYGGAEGDGWNYQNPNRLLSDAILVKGSTRISMATTSVAILVSLIALT